METTTIKTEIIRYIGDGSMSSAARRMGFTPGYLSRVMSGKAPPSEKVLTALGVGVVYVRLPSAEPVEAGE